VRSNKRLIAQTIGGAALFIAGAAAGVFHAHTASAENKFGQPKTVLHVVIYKFKETTSEHDRQQALDGITELAGKIPGIKNIWLKTQRNQMKDFNGLFAIEFASAEAAADYAENPAHEGWSKKWQSLRETSLSFQITNP